MIDQLTSRAATAFAALDVSEENARIAEIEAERERIAAAIDRAEQRKSEITRELEAVRDPEPGIAVANALMANVPASEAAEQASNRDRLFQERADLHRGIGELRKRDEDCVIQILGVQQAAGAKAGEVAAPVIEAIIAQARAAGEQIVTAYASLAAISDATRTGRGEADRLGQAVAGLMSREALLNRRNIVNVPASTAAMLAPLQSKGPAIRTGSLQCAAIPGDHNLIAALAAVTSTMAAGKR